MHIILVVFDEWKIDSRSQFVHNFWPEKVGRTAHFVGKNLYVQNIGLKKIVCEQMYELKNVNGIFLDAKKLEKHGKNRDYSNVIHCTSKIKWYIWYNLLSKSQTHTQPPEPQPRTLVVDAQPMLSGSRPNSTPKGCQWYGWHTNLMSLR